MEKKDLLFEINEIKKKIVANSKDAHFAKSLISDLIQTTKESVHEPIELDCGKAIDTFRGGTFEIVKTSLGILYRTFGGYAVFTTPQNTALYGVLLEIIDTKDDYEKLSKEEKDDIDTVISVIATLMNVPLISFQNEEFSYNMANAVMKYLLDSCNKAMGKPLQDETPVENAEFKTYVESLENIKDALSDVGDV